MTSFRKYSVGHYPDLHKKIRIALGHIPVEHENIEASYMGTPNLSRGRKNALSNLLNDLIQHSSRYPAQRPDLLILPEVSIPHRWADFLTKWAKKHQIGIICGLEHRIDSKKQAWNELLTTLPFIDKDGYKNCVPLRRLKKHYSPNETFRLTNNNLRIPDEENKSRYQLVQWRGASFAVYNCYEITSLQDRGLFKGMVDFIVCSEFNPDVNYFSNIIESAARDLHCFVIQVNCSQYGDSRVVRPSKTEKLTPLHIKGGENQTFLIIELALDKLRSHQLKQYGLQKESDDFKPTPPDFDREEVRNRIKLGHPK